MAVKQTLFVSRPRPFGGERRGRGRCGTGGVRGFRSRSCHGHKRRGGTWLTRAQVGRVPDWASAVVGAGRNVARRTLLCAGESVQFPLKPFDAATMPCDVIEREGER